MRNLLNGQVHIVSERTSLSGQISPAGTALRRLRFAPVPATDCMERGISTTGVYKQLHGWRASTHLQERPVHAHYHYIARHCRLTYREKFTGQHW